MNDILNEKAGVLEFDNYEYRKENNFNPTAGCLPMLIQISFTLFI